MNTERIKKTQKETAYPNSISVQQALLKVWNECEQEKIIKNNTILPHINGDFFADDVECAYDDKDQTEGERTCKEKNNKRKRPSQGV
jgi:hypothetical protein